MILRTIAVASAAILTLGGLTGCRSHVGTAATVNGQRISESRVNDFVTVAARPLQLKDSSGKTVAVQPRAYALETLIFAQLLPRLLARTSHGVPSKGQLAQVTSQILAGKSETAFANGNGITGFTSSFAKVWVHTQALGTVLSTYAQQGLDVNSLVHRAGFTVSVSPRYGGWDAKNVTFDFSAAAGVPGFVSLQPTPASTTAPGAP